MYTLLLSVAGVFLGMLVGVFFLPGMGVPDKLIPMLPFVSGASLGVLLGTRTFNNTAFHRGCLVVGLLGVSVGLSGFLFFLNRSQSVNGTLGDAVGGFLSFWILCGFAPVAIAGLMRIMGVRAERNRASVPSTVD